MQIVINELLAQYNLTGKGRLVVLLHGWGDSSKGLAGLAKELTGHYQVLAVDLPGFGGSQAPGQVWDLDNYSEFLKALLEKLQLSQPYAVIGHSNGGALAIRSIAAHKLTPNKLILIASSGIRSGGGGRRFMLNVLAKTGNIATIWMPDKQRRALRKSLYQTAGSDLMVAPELEETFKKVVRQDVQAEAASIKLPTLIIYGQQDTSTPPAYGQRYADLIDGSQLVVIEEAGHFVHIDQAASVHKLVGDFLK